MVILFLLLSFTLFVSIFLSLFTLKKLEILIKITMTTISSLLILSFNHILILNHDSLSKCKIESYYLFVLEVEYFFEVAGLKSTNMNVVVSVVCNQNQEAGHSMLSR